jgi:uncharacterized protein YecA (UPF0149 family)
MERNMQPTEQLTAAQYKVLNHLIAGISITEAARLAGVHRNTVTNWRRQIPTFATLLNEALQERALLFREQTEALALKAIEVLRTILHNEEASPSVRLRAALAVLKMAATEPAVAAPAAKTEIAHNAAQQPIRRPAEPGRNSQCPCGSGLKYKRCCANPRPAATPITQAAA